MKYALIGDLHSCFEDTNAVLKHINETAEDATIIGLGDLFECKIGKKRAKNISGLAFEEAAEHSEHFSNLLQFPSVRGNQEERIMQVTGLHTFKELPEILNIDGAHIIHGHQFKWSSDWKPLFTEAKQSVFFFGHSHDSAFYKKGKRKSFTYGKPIQLKEKKYGVNVGAVIRSREWCLYDSTARTVTFMKAQQMKKHSS
ncbi:metallophosphoesterase family protein [Viridibacillus arvi]|uniref:metallophosphoesterase family protein n=1 Tax=Viridibacillus arvi TaxID=263475 RepID=UPI00187B564B|nr:metallophosphoesterase family protein [Viridibacillus sp. JNUCC-6]QOV10996.1 metallophosphoesterase family protein [Viridibacillus sp. JNUCC-6]